MPFCKLVLPGETLALKCLHYPGMHVITLTKQGLPRALQTAGRKAETRARESEQSVLRAELREEVISWLTQKGIWEGEGRGLEGPTGK